MLSGITYWWWYRGLDGSWQIVPCHLKDKTTYFEFTCRVLPLCLVVEWEKLLWVMVQETRSTTLRSSMLPDLEQDENTVFILVLGFKSQTFYFWERVLRENCPAVVLSCPMTLSLHIPMAATAPFLQEQVSRITACKISWMAWKNILSCFDPEITEIQFVSSPAGAFLVQIPLVCQGDLFFFKHIRGRYTLK